LNPNIGPQKQNKENLLCFVGSRTRTTLSESKVEHEATLPKEKTCEFLTSLVGSDDPTDTKENGRTVYSMQLQRLQPSLSCE
jgi:hypothetical protein